MKLIKRLLNEWQATRAALRVRKQSADRAAFVALRVALNGCR